MKRVCSVCRQSKLRDTEFAGEDGWTCKQCAGSLDSDSAGPTPTQPTGQDTCAMPTISPAASRKASDGTRNSPGAANEGVLKVTEDKPKGPSTGRKRRRVGILPVVTMKTVDNVTGEVALSLEVFLHYDSPIPFTPETGGPAFQRLDPSEMADFSPVRYRIVDTLECEDVSHTVLRNNKTGTVFEIRRFHLKIREILELQAFPFDRQVFKVKLSTWMCDFEPWFAPPEDSIQRVRDDPTLKANDAVVNYEGTEWSLDWVDCRHEQGSGVERTCLVTLGMSRSATFYLWNFALIIFLVVELATLTAAIDYTTFADRANLTYTLLLTYVTFQFVASTFVPRINYLTYLDRYVTMGMFMLVALILESFLITKVNASSSDLAHHLDTLFFTAFNVIWLGLHATVVLGSTRGWFRTPWSQVRTEDESTCQSVGTSRGIPSD